MTAVQRSKERTNWKGLLVCLAIPVLVGAVSALVSRAGMERFAQVQKPPLSPPEWLFPVAWTLLYLMMGYASYVVWRSPAEKQRIDRALRWYGAQLCANFWWSPLFFSWSLYLPALGWLILMLVLVVVTLVCFWRIERRAGLLLVPYLCWLVFAGYLNAGVWLLNR
ncbi:MAG: tryptophan-rich sensory protein [Clostridiales bacterium]|nr:tryptophan-rich sensory protein [Clostridiales bacterium]